VAAISPTKVQKFLHDRQLSELKISRIPKCEPIFRVSALTSHKKTPSTMPDDDADGASQRCFQSFTSMEELAEYLGVPMKALYCVQIK
jgi:hypothetical protein